ncbi:MAG: SPOR domain-containing protein [Spirochaetaceae bacterium]|nr:SPOR domain-containing protein [Spirochaetaceae bacterium]
MEQKKILWIIASVGVFLLVVMGAALIINRPAQAVEPALASLQSPNDTWIMPPATEPASQASATEETGSFQTQGQLVGDAAVPGEPAGSEGTKVDTMTVYSGTTNVYGAAGTTTIDLNSLKEAVQQAAITATNQAGASAVASGSSSAAAQAPAAETTKPVSSPTKSAASSPAKPVVSSPAKSASTAKAAPAKSTNKLVDQFWVQVASVTNKNNAEAARAALAANKIESEIFTHNADDGKLYYRLRVGPYTTRTEAEYWKGRIALIDEFADTQSYITNSTAKKQ